MKDFVIERTTVVLIELEEAWKFFSSPLNLQRITPEDMQFEIKSTDIDRPIFNGMLIDYKVRPLFNIPVGWRTEIRNVEEPRRFTDAQLKGPFAKWEHEHKFIGTPYGTRIEDRVVYRLPFGLLGRMLHRIVVNKRVEEIFDHRERTLKTIFAAQ